ncbi:MAG: DUF4870 domain-containing protein [Planctomycetota bacterium]
MSADRPGPGGPVREETAQDWERTYATFLHLTYLLSFVAPVLGPLIGALVMWLIKKDESQLIHDHGKEVVNFQISLLIYTLISAVLTVVLIGFPMLAAVAVLGIVGMIMGAIAGNRGVYFRYPVCLRLIA